jgi:hypothetical protein
LNCQKKRLGLQEGKELQLSEKNGKEILGKEHIVSGGGLPSRLKEPQVQSLRDKNAFTSAIWLQHRDKFRKEDKSWKTFHAALKFVVESKGRE